MRIEALLDLAADFGDGRVAVQTDRGPVGYVALRGAARAFAQRLNAASSAARVAFLGENSLAFPVGLFGSAYAGRAFCPLNYRLPDEALHRLLARVAPAVLVVDDAMLARVNGAPGLEVVRSAELVEACWSDREHETVEPTGDEQDVAVSLFTSGTSGEPKSALLRHGNLTAYIVQTTELLSASSSEVAIVSVPPYHIAAVSAVLSATYVGRTFVQLPAFEPDAWVAATARFGVTHAMLVPTMLDRVLDSAERTGASLSTLRAIAYGGGRMPRSVIRRALRLLPECSFANAYGLTETSSTIAVLGPEEHAAARTDDADADRRLGSVGKPVPGVEIEIRDPSGRALGPGEAGEIWVRGAQVSGQYAERSATDAQGWFATKDLGWFDTDGYLFVDGRLDDVIVRGGENISPGEIEDVLREHPSVADVAVAGVPDDAWGERVVAFVVVRDGKPLVEELQRWVRSRLRSTKTPSDVVFTDALPYNDAGKLMRRSLRATFARHAATSNAN